MIEYTRNVRAVSGASQISGGGVISLGGFTLTVPATGTAALLGTSNVFTAPQVLSVGSVGAPGLVFTGDTTTGFFREVANTWTWGRAGARRIKFDDTLVGLGSGLTISWANSSEPTTTYDLQMGRDGSGYWNALKSSALTAAPALYTFRHNSSGTPAAGYGSSIVVQGASSTTSDQDMFRMVTTWVVATHGSRTARTVFNVYDTAIREAIRIEASGTAPMVGFLGAAAVARTSAYTITNVTPDRAYDANATTIDEIADTLGTLIADLQLFGLLG